MEPTRQPLRLARLVLLALSLLFALPSLGCSLIVDFDASKIPSDAAPILDAQDGADAQDAADATDAADTADTLPPAVLSVSPTPADFGSVAIASTVDLTLTVSNTAGAATSGAVSVTLAGADAAQFALGTTGTCVSGTTTLAAGQTCAVIVTFKPTTSGAKSASLQITADPGGTATAALSGTGLAAPALAISPTTSDFGSVVVGSSSADTTFTVSNAAGNADTGAVSIALSGTDAALFVKGVDNCSTKILHGGDSCTVTVHLSPTASTAIGAKSATITASATPGGSAAATLTGTVIGAAALSISPTPKDFGGVNLNASNTQTFTVTNATGAAATSAISFALSGTDAASFAIATTGSCQSGTTTLAGGGSCTIDVTFTPTTAGSKSATLGVTATTGGTASAALTGTGLGAAAVAIAPSPKDFGSVAIGNSSTDVTFTVSNAAGNAPTGTLAVSLTGTDASQFAITSSGTTCASGTTTLAGGASCVVKLHFSPTTTGAKSAALSVSATPGGSASAALTGTGIPAALLTISPTPQDFGSILAGATTANTTFTVANAAGAATTGTLAISLTGTDAAEFTIASGGTCTSTTKLAGGANCTVLVAFTPGSGATAGGKSAQLQAVAAPGGTATASLSGTVLSPAALTIAPTTNAYGGVVVGSSSAPFTFTVSNATGNATTGALGISLAGTNATDFSITGGTCTSSTTLAGGTSCTVLVTFSPASATALGTKGATLTVTASPGGSASASLSGTALAPAALSILPTTWDFGSFLAGVSSSTQTFTVSNAAGAQATSAIAVSLGGTNSGLFTIVTDACTGQTLAGGASCSVTAMFTPGAAATAGAKSANLQASATTGGNASATLTGTVLNPAQLTITPTSYDFGGFLPPASSAPVAFTVSNAAGNATTSAIAAATVSGTDASLFTIGTDNCAGTSLAGGTSCTISVTFNTASATAGAKRASLGVSATTGGGASAALSGTVLAVANLSLTGTPTDFGTVAAGALGPLETYTVTNAAGSATSGTLSFSLTGTDATQFTIVTGASGGTCTAGTTLAGGASCTIVVQFTPGNSASAGVKSTTLSVSASPGGNPTLALTGTVSGLAMAPMSWDFGPVVSPATGSHTFTVTNYTASTTATLTPSLAGSGQFTIASTTCSTTLASLATCTVDVTFAPTSASGLQSTTLTVTDGTLTATSALTGTGG